jgi:hypothetical protein
MDRIRKKANGPKGAAGKKFGGLFNRGDKIKKGVYHEKGETE